MKKKYIIGIDEVGRGCLAGPVAVAAFCVKKGEQLRNKNLGALKDSKKLTAEKRKEWLKHFKEKNNFYAVAKVWPKAIDRLNISSAANLAAGRVFERLCKKYNLPAASCAISLDGGLYLFSKERSASLAKTVIKGDEKIKAIAAASIVAKVNRDKLMVKLATTYPDYGLEVNKGYGTKKHISAIKKRGLSPIHRTSFTKNLLR